jgi:cobalt-zinc-cadmium efflux system outer membrane protein
MKSLYFLTIFILWPVALSDAAGKGLDPGFLSSLRAEAAKTHPSTTAAGYRADAAAREVSAIRLWDDPMVGLSFMSAEKMMRRDDGDIRVMVEQTLPRPALYAAERGKADAMRRAGLENARSAVLRSGAEAAKIAIELALADESISIQSGQIERLRDMEVNARQRALAPGGAGIDALKIESEMIREIQILEAAKRTRESLSRRLNLSLGRPLDSPWPTLELPAGPLPVPVAAAEVARISHANPKIRALRESAKAADVEIEITRRERQPQVAVGVEGNLYSGGDYRSTMVGVRMNLPWFNDAAYNARTDAAILEKNAASADVEVLRREIAGEVLQLTAEVANAAAQARAYAGDIHTRTRETARLTESAWISSKASLGDLLEANRMLWSVRLEQRRLIALQMAALEELYTLVPPRP